MGYLFSTTLTEEAPKDICLLSFFYTLDVSYMMKPSDYHE